MELSKYQLAPNDIVISRAGSVGASFLLRDVPDRAVFASYLIRFCPISPIIPSYVASFLQSSTYWASITDKSAGIAVPNVNAKKLETIELPIAPANEQARIVAKIEELFSDLDAGVASLERARANLKRYRAAVLKAAVEGRLTEQWRKAHPNVEPASKLLERILAERRKKWEEAHLARFATAGKASPKGWKEKYPEPAKPDFEGLPDLPEGWCWGGLEQLSSAVRVICYGILMPKENLPDGIPYVRVKDLKGDKIDLPGLHRTSPEIAAQYARASLAPGDVLLAIRGTYGRVAEVPPVLSGGNITQDTARIEVSPLVSPTFIAWALRSDDCQRFLKRVARGVAVKGVNIADVRVTPIPLVPQGEQFEIVEEIERRLSVLETETGEIDHAISRASRLRQSILKRAFEGKLVPQDPNDEPASVLLECIRAARAAEGLRHSARVRRRGRQQPRVG